MENKAYAAVQNLFTNYAAIVGAVGQDADGIGYSGFNFATNVGAKAVSIGGVVPATDTVNAGKYPYARMLHLFTNKATETPATLDFVQFVLSPGGQEVLTQLGDVPHS
jgi:ABC-type phosphate transport system substrate-binding protein